jgi:hypothetical protein
MLPRLPDIFTTQVPVSRTILKEEIQGICKKAFAAYFGKIFARSG